MVKRQQKELDTSLEAILKDGSIRLFNSIEEASKKLKLSIVSIKIRANKPGSSGKDGTQFKWLNDHTARHYRAKKSRSKGHGYELQIIKDLTELGFNGLVSSRSQSKRLDNAKIDIAETEDKLSCYILCKATASIPAIATITKECGFKDRPLAIFWKKQNGSTKKEEFVAIPKDYFYQLLKCYHKHNK